MFHVKPKCVSWAVVYSVTPHCLCKFINLYSKTLCPLHGRGELVSNVLLRTRPLQNARGFSRVDKVFDNIIIHLYLVDKDVFLHLNLVMPSNVVRKHYMMP